ncbi:hypothetical protein Tsubulata_022885 [Turnera subulata]|uniref:O-methyltransferase domain-containing protein n=1 Tax=Turnera subulata TaxID=218843 RepID=A0A9Q0FLE9_9ROSI|nr:hypothetical protein Tsubulata_022885 [Turnera subulata]
MEGTDSDSQFGDGEEAQAAGVDIWKYVFGFTNMAVVKCAIELGIADTIEKHDGPMTLEDLSSSLGCDPCSVYRVMRLLVHNNFFKEKPTGQGTAIGYVQSPLSSCLLRQGKNSLADLILLESSPAMVAAWHCLASRVRANGVSSAFEGAHGADLWKYCAANPDHNKLLQDGMASASRVLVPAIIEGCPGVFQGINSLVDVGGGNGIALSLLVKAFPWIQGINFDLPHVISVASERDGVKHVGGNMFESVPSADAAFLMWVLHDWNDDDCVKILKKCKEAIARDKGKVIIIEAIVGEKKENDKLEYARLMLDMVLMAHTTKGKGRTSKEWEDVLFKAGFSGFNIKPLGAALHSVIEAFP